LEYKNPNKGKKRRNSWYFKPHGEKRTIHNIWKPDETKNVLLNKFSALGIGGAKKGKLAAPQISSN